LVATQTFSDHSPDQIKVYASQQQFKVPYRMNVSHLKDVALQQLIKYDWTATVSLMAGSDSQHVLNRCLSWATSIVKLWSKDKAHLQHQVCICCDTELILLKGQLQQQPANYKLQLKLLELEASLVDTDCQKARLAHLALQLAWVKDDDQCSKCFFGLLRPWAASNQLAGLTTNDGTVVSDTPGMLALANSYYDTVLNKNHTLPCPTATEDREYILSFVNKSINHTSSLQLDSKISKAEVILAISKIPKGRVCGPDGVSLEFFLVFQEQTVPLLTQVFNEAW
jgi:hypothetical protein